MEQHLLDAVAAVLDKDEVAKRVAACESVWRTATDVVYVYVNYRISSMLFEEKS